MDFHRTTIAYFFSGNTWAYPGRTLGSAPAEKAGSDVGIEP